MIPAEPAPWQPGGDGGALGNGTLELWRMPVGPCANTDETARLEPGERAGAERMLSPGRRAQYVAGHALLNSIREKHGTPLFTSLSHSGEWVVAAAARSGAVGVDVEFLREDRPLERLSRRFFTPEEHAWLAQSPPEERMPRFYLLWTAKEALFKALGMPAGAAHFTARRVLGPGDDPTVQEVSVVEGCTVGWFWAAPGYLGAYAVPADVLRVCYLREA